MSMRLVPLLVSIACTGASPEPLVPACDPTVTEVRAPTADPAFADFEGWLATPEQALVLDLMWDDGQPFPAWDEVLLAVEPDDDRVLLRAEALAPDGETCVVERYAIRAARLVVDPDEPALEGTVWAWFDPSLVRLRGAFSSNPESPLPVATRWTEVALAHGLAPIGAPPDPLVQLDGDGETGTVTIDARPVEDFQPAFRAASGAISTP